MGVSFLVTHFYYSPGNERKKNKEKILLFYKHFFNKWYLNIHARPIKYVWKLLNTYHQKNKFLITSSADGTWWMNSDGARDHLKIKIWSFYRSRWRNRWGKSERLRLKENQMSLGKRIQPKLLLFGAGRDFIYTPVLNVSSGGQHLTFF